MPQTNPTTRGKRWVSAHDGAPLTLQNLPAANGIRWTPKRKADIVAAVRGGLLDIEAACARYSLTVEEFMSWQSGVERHGLDGLRTTRIQEYRAS